MLPVSFASRRRDRKLRQIARVLVSLDDSARAVRPPTRRVAARAKFRPAAL